jgi:DNA-binding MarR family transcriptional regulator
MGKPDVSPIGELIVPDHSGDHKDRVARNTVFKQVAGDTIADRMEALSLEVRGMSDPQYAGLASTETLNAVAAALKATRRKIDQIFEHEGFATSPACDIMLELFEARSRSAPLSVPALCASINCASSTLNRWMKALEVMQLVAMSSEESHGGPAYIALTEKGYLKTAQALQLHLHE